MSGEYVYLAVRKRDRWPLAAFTRKHELQSWCVNRGDPSEWATLYCVRTINWEDRTDVREFEFKHGQLTVKKP
jgi:hypothetical protein